MYNDNIWWWQLGWVLNVRHLLHIRPTEASICSVQTDTDLHHTSHCPSLGEESKGIFYMNSKTQQRCLNLDHLWWGVPATECRLSHEHPCWTCCSVDMPCFVLAVMTDIVFCGESVLAGTDLSCHFCFLLLSSGIACPIWSELRLHLNRPKTHCSVSLPSTCLCPCWHGSTTSAIHDDTSYPPFILPIELCINDSCPVRCLSSHLYLSVCDTMLNCPWVSTQSPY